MSHVFHSTIHFICSISCILSILIAFFGIYYKSNQVVLTSVPIWCFAYIIISIDNYILDIQIKRFKNVHVQNIETNRRTY